MSYLSPFLSLSSQFFSASLSLSCFISFWSSLFFCCSHFCRFAHALSSSLFASMILNVSFFGGNIMVTKWKNKIKGIKCVCIFKGKNVTYETENMIFPLFIIAIATFFSLDLLILHCCFCFFFHCYSLFLWYTSLFCVCGCVWFPTMVMSYVDAVGSQGQFDCQHSTFFSHCFVCTPNDSSSY